MDNRLPAGTNFSPDTSDIIYRQESTLIHIERDAQISRSVVRCLARH
jgi:hypothetical protein